MKLHHVILAGAVVAFSASAAHATTWRMATPYPDSNFHTQNINMFAEEVEKESEGKLKINVHPAGSLVKHQEIKNAIRSSQVEIGEFIISGLANENPVFALDSVPTQVEVPDLPQAFSTGRVNAMITSTSTGVNASAWDFLTHFYDVAAFLPKNIVAVNKRSFDGLDPETQQVVLQAAVNAEKRGWEMSEKDHEMQRKKLEENGIEVSNGSEALNASLHEYGKTMATEWGKEAGSQGQEILDAYLK